MLCLIPIFMSGMKRLLLLFVVTVALFSCQWTQQPRQTRKTDIQCAEGRLASSFKFHKQAKDYFRSYYKTRKESELFFAWYSSEDSIYMARSVRKCFDKKNKHFHAVRNLYQKNMILQRLIVQNMRHDAQAQLSELYLEEYRDIFVRDIQ